MNGGKDKKKKCIFVGMPFPLNYHFNFQLAAKPAFYDIIQGFQCDILSVIFYFGDEGTFFIYPAGKFSLCHLFLLSCIPNLKPDAQSFEFTFYSVSFW